VVKSPFKVLDAYSREDKDIFFGRDKEIQALYTKTTESNLVLLYGASGTGKTSLIHCGLSSRFGEDEWLPLFVRRKDDLASAIVEEINKYLPRRLKSNTPLPLAIKALHLAHFRPIYLIFDQLEEVFISGTIQEQRHFFGFLELMLQSEIQCKIILVIREEYLAYLSEYEEQVPSLFDHRLRIERMRPHNAKEVILRSALAFGIQMVAPSQTADMITDLLSFGNEIELTYLQVYLDRLYVESYEREKSLPVTFSPELVAQMSDIDDVLGDFLEAQVQKVMRVLPHSEQEHIWDILQQLITEEGTRTLLAIQTLIQNLEKLQISRPIIDFCIEELRQARLLRILDGRIELAHDSLAAKVHEKISAEDRLRAMVLAVIKDGMTRYQRLGVLMDKKDLEYIAPHLETLRLDKAELALIERSRKRLFRLRTWQNVSVASFIAILLALLAWASVERQKAVERGLALEKEKIYAEEKAKKQAEISRRLDEYLGLFLAKEKELELHKKEVSTSLDSIKKIETRLKNALDSAEIMRRRAERSNQEALEAKWQAEAEKQRAAQLQRVSKANELAARALLEAERKPLYAIRVAEAAYMLDANTNTENALINIFQQEYFSRYRDRKRPIAVQVRSFLQANFAPQLTAQQRRELGI
jgi:hypothetical protein